MQLVPLPLSTFGAIADAGWRVTVWCSSCKSARPLEITEALRLRSPYGATFRCQGTRYDGCRCTGSGVPTIKPARSIPIASAIKRCILYCRRCVPYWEIHDVQLGVPPWPAMTNCERFRCPSCGGLVDWTWHGGDGTPHTEGYRAGGQTMR